MGKNKGVTSKIKIPCILLTLITVLVLGLGGLSHALAAEQIVTLTPSTSDQAVGSSFTLTASYDVDDGDNTLTGIGVRFHFDSSKLQFTGYSNVFSTGLIGAQDPQNDTSDFDSDPNTDKFLLVAWSDPFAGNWPNQTLPLDVAQLGFTVDPGAPAGATPVNVTFSSYASGAGYTATGTGATVTITIPPGTISGHVSYSGGAPGQYLIGYWDSSLGDTWYDHDPEDVTFSTNGSYTLDVPPGSYFIAAFRDSSGNQDREDNEPVGFYTTTPGTAGQNGSPTAVNLASGENKTINFTIYDRPYFVSVDVDRDVFPDSGQPAGLPTGEVLWAEATVGYRPGFDQVTVKVVSGPGISATDPLKDDGLIPDEVAGDGVFTGWVGTGGVVQNGTYEFLITSNNGLQEDDEDILEGSALDLPTVVSPGDYVISFTPTFDWDAVTNPDASNYSLYITDKANPTSFADFIFVKEGLTATQYALTTQDLTLIENTTYYWLIAARDASGDNSSHSDYLSFTVDSIPPGTTATPNPGSYNADFDVILTADETADITYTTDGSDPTTSGTAVTEPSPVTIPITTEGLHTIQFLATDSAGNQEGTKSLQVTLDKTLPVTTPSLAEGTYGTAKSVTLSATDTNLDATYFDLLTSDPGATPSPPTTPYTDAINLAVSGEAIDYWLVFYSVDQAGNAEGVNVAKYTIDTRVPETTASFDPQPNQYDTSYYSNNQAGVTITLASQGNTIYYTTDGTEPTESSPSAQDSVPLTFDTEGTHTVRYFAKNPQALTEEKRTLVLVLDFTAPATPVLDPAPTSPTNATPQTIGGTKDADTAIYLQGVVDPIVPLNDAAIWGYNYPLQEGSNQFALVAKDPAGNESAPTAQTTIVLDTVIPYTSGHDPEQNTTVPQPLNKQVIVHVKDDGVGVEESSITLTVAGVEYLYDNAAMSINAANVNDMVVTFTPPENYSADTNVSVKVEAQDLAGNVMTPDVYAFLTGSNVGITPTAIGLATGDTFTFTATGGSTPYAWSRDPEANSSITNITETTADFSASAVGQYTVTVTDAATDEATATVDVVTPIAISTTPANDALESGGEFTFAASGGKVDGEVVWEVDQGSIDPASGLYTVTTADTIQVTVTAYDATYNKSHVSPVTETYTFTVYPEVAVTNKPTAPTTVNAGEYSTEFKVEGGDEDYTWSVIGPEAVAGGIGSSFKFKAPSTGNFAGEYTITVTDGKGFTDEFVVYVPIKLVAWDGTKIIPSNCPAGDSITLMAQGVGTDLDITYEENPVTAGEAVLENVPTAVTQNTFDVDAGSPGSAIVTVRDAADTEGNYTGSLRIDVIGVGTLSGQVTNIDPLVDPADGDVTIWLEMLGTDQIYPSVLTPDGVDWNYEITPVPWGTYKIVVTVEDQTAAPVGPEYVATRTVETVAINQDQVTRDLSLPDMTPITESFELSVDMPGDPFAGTYDYIVLSYPNNSVVAVAEDVTDDAFTINLAEGQYVLMIMATGYKPWASDVIDETTVMPVEPALEAFTPDPAVSVGHIPSETGFTLKVVTSDFAGSFTAAIGANDITNDFLGTGTSADPMTYTWTAGVSPDSGTEADTPEVGDTKYTVIFDFTDAGTGGWAGAQYTVTWVEKADPTEQADANKGEGQDELEKEVNEDTLYSVVDQDLFYPSGGTQLPLILKGPNGEDIPAVINIPPIPADYFYVDDYPAPNTLNYDVVTDYYDIQTGPITPDTLLRVVVSCYTFGGDSLGGGMNIKFERALDGALVRYNPIPGDGTNRDANAPRLTLPLLLNPQSSFFQNFKRLSDAKSQLVILVSERGDGYPGAFHQEQIPFDVQDNGLVTLYANHTTSIGVGSSSGGAADGGGGGGGGGCFIATAADGPGAVLALVVLILALLSSTGVMILRRLPRR